MKRKIDTKQLAITCKAGANPERIEIGNLEMIATTPTPTKQKTLLALKYRILTRLPSRMRLWLIRRGDERQLRVLKDKYHPLIEAAKTANNTKEEGSIVSQYLSERDLILHPTYGMESEFLERKARKLGIRVPDKQPGEGEDDGNWEQSNSTGDWMLTPEAERKLRNEIRQEERANADEWRKWATLIFAVVGTVFAFMSLRTKQKQPDLCPVNYYRNDVGACVFARPAVPKAPNAPNTAPQAAPTLTP
jgi:hypothetical protein